MQSTVGCFPKLCFLPFYVAQMLMGLRKQFIQLGPVLLDLIIIIIIIIIIIVVEFKK